MVTAAAVIMVFVFLTVATMSMVQLKEMGVGLAVAVLLDATVPTTPPTAHQPAYPGRLVPG